MFQGSAVGLADTAAGKYIRAHQPCPTGAPMRQLRSLLLVPLLLATAQPSPGSSQTSGLGLVSFPNSGARRAQPSFLRGLALLHSFEYDDAAEAFREAQRLDSTFAMAYWGEALTYDHPLWGEHDSTAARETLARLDATPEERVARGGSARERAYLGAVEALYGAGSLKERRQAYEQAMARVHEEHPSDLEAASLHALALLSLRSGGKTDLRPSVRAAAIAEEVLRRNPTHPGATHYLIHAYDEPLLAPLGLPVARRYARIAPRAEHALHMPSHIFVHLGLWDDMVASNEAAWTASKAWVRRKGRRNDELDLHAAAWLHYGYLQQGRYRRARALTDSLGALFPPDARDSATHHVHAYLGMVDAQNVVETRRWDSKPLLAPKPWELILQAAAGAMPRRDRETVAAGLARYRLRADTISQHHDGTMPPGVRAFVLKLTAMDARVNGRDEEAVAALTEAATLEEDLSIVGPPVDPPARELLADLLLELGRSPEAAAAYDATLLRTPLRSAALLGRARAAVKAGDAEGAARWYGLLLRNWHAADADLPELPEARSGANRVRASR
jgi:tetratricopeptide (TPR) repeat protein